MTISLVTIAEGLEYASFVKPWREAVLGMHHKPDEIIIVIGAGDEANVRQHDWSFVPTRIITLQEPFSTAYFNAGVCAARSEWISYCGIDDLMLPHAYVEINYEADIIVGTVLLNNERAWVGVWDTQLMQHVNPLPAHSLYRKELWITVNGYPNIRWSDWGFWLLCAQQNPKVSQGLHPIAVFDTGQDRQTMSGSSLDPAIRMQADIELQAFRDCLP